jgi:hypothetical protein
MNRKDEMIRTVMKLHQCADCPVRCMAAAKPYSFLARIHRWHMTWWPGWKIFQAELRTGEAKGSVHV